MHSVVFEKYKVIWVDQNAFLDVEDVAVRFINLIAIEIVVLAT